MSAGRVRTTAPIILLDPSPDQKTDRKTSWHPPATYEPDDADPDGCASPAAKRRGNAAWRGCPLPSVSITTIPQDGPGESPGPSITPSMPETPSATLT